MSSVPNSWNNKNKSSRVINSYNNSDNYIAIYASSNRPGYESVSLPNYPDEISDSTSANYNEEALLGKSSPLVTYTGTGLREVSFSFDVHREEAKNIDRLFKIARASLYPTYGTQNMDNKRNENSYTGYMRPTITVVRFGDFYMKGITRSCNFIWKKPIVNNQYQVCTIQLTLADIPENAVDMRDILNAPVANPFHKYTDYSDVN